jgi:hypothetical protein
VGAPVTNADDWTEFTPIGSERAITNAKNYMGEAFAELKAARLAELEAKRVERRARTEAILGGDCPKVTRGGWTTAERDAWVERRTLAELEALDAAVVVRENAADHLRTVREQSSLVQSRHKSVMQAYQMAGVGER